MNKLDSALVSHQQPPATTQENLSSEEYSPHFANQNTGAPSGQTAFEVQWKERAVWVEGKLKEALGSTTSGCPERLASALEYVLLAPGKRLRPLLALWGAEAVGADWQVAGPAAVAVEMIHCYSLVHDDLPAMDDDDLRRGRPTCHIQYDEATAILTGDALQPMAFEVLSQSNTSPDVLIRAIKLLAHAAGPLALVGGQADDLNAETHGGDEDLLARIHARKTGAMIRVSLELGGLLGGASDSQLRCLSEYGTAIGQAFQIVDDLLDVEGSHEKLGKRVGKDQQRGKLTYPGFYGIEASRQAAAAYTSDALKAIEPLGARSNPLAELAKVILERSH